MKIEEMANFITRWRKEKFLEDRSDILELFLFKNSISYIYDFYYQAVTDLKEDIYGNKVDDIEVSVNGAYKFICYDDLVNFDI